MRPHACPPCAPSVSFVSYRLTGIRYVVGVDGLLLLVAVDINVPGPWRCRAGRDGGCGGTWGQHH
jgi:hypothetical protein